MKKELGSSLLLAALWVAPLSAEEPEVVVGPDAEVTPVEFVDPLADGDISILSFSSGVAEGGEVCPHDAADHVCVEAHCEHLAGECLHNLPLSADGPTGEELSLYSLASSSGVAMENGQPLPFQRSLGGEQHEATAALVNTPAFGGAGLLQENSLRTTTPFARESFGANSGGQPGKASVFGQLLVRNTQPAPVSAADREYAQRLASIDQLRDTGLATGNAALLQQADKLEQELKGSTAKRGLRLFRR